MRRKVLSFIITLSLVFQQIGFAGIATELNLAGHLAKMSSGLTPDRFRPVHIRFFAYDSLNDNIKVMLDKGDLKVIKQGELNQSTRELLNYFLVGVSLPNDVFWVNLRPDSENEIIDDWLAKTDVGKIMLEADLQLKKDTARFTSPETIEGKEYWNKLYQKAEELYGYQEVTIPTLTRPWIVPNEIIVRETKDSSYIYKATLKVMLEQDFLKDSSIYNFKDERSKALNEYSSQLIRELIIPKLTTEVNLSKRYSALRQVYYSLIFSRWFKSRFANQTGKYASLIDKKDLTGLTSISAWSKTAYFEAYKKSFAQGEYNIKETVRTPTGQVIRSYFSGGLKMDVMNINGGRASSAIEQSLLTAGLIRPVGKAIGIKAMSSPVMARNYATLDDVDISNKVLLVRPDLNVVASGGHISDMENPHPRMIAHAKSIKEAAEKGAEQVIIFHQGRLNEGYDFMDTPFDHAQQLSNIIGRPVKAVDDLYGPAAIKAIKELKAGEIIVLKPVRSEDPSIPNAMMEDNPYFVAALRPYIDFYVLDGFSVAHRDSPSVTGFNGIPTIVGRVMQSEIENAIKDMNPPEPYLALIGGGKITEKFTDIRNTLVNKKESTVALGGKPANLGLVAAQILALPEAQRPATEDGMFNIAVETLGRATADGLKAEGMSFLSELIDLMIKYPGRIIIPIDMVYIDANGKRQEVTLKDGKVEKGFDFVLRGIGPQTAQLYAEVAGRKENPFASAFVLGPLDDPEAMIEVRDAAGKVTTVPAFDPETRIVLDGVQKNVPFWSIGGGHTGADISRLGYVPTSFSLAGGALADFKSAYAKSPDLKKSIAGVKFAIENRADKPKPYVPSTYAEASTMSHTQVLGTIARVFNEAGSKMFVRTHVFISGGRVDAARFIKTPMSDIIKGSLIQSGHKELVEAFAGFESVDVDAINPYVNFGLSDVYTGDNRPINAARLRKALAQDPNIALILVPGEVNKKGKQGPAGDIDTKNLSANLIRILDKALRQHGVDPNTIKDVLPRPLPAIAQVVTSDIESKLKVAVIYPVPGDPVSYKMQLAQDAGINLKQLLEKEFPAITAKEREAEEQMAQKPLLGEPYIAPTVSKKEEKSLKPFPLSGVSLAGVKITDSLQTIYLSDPNLGHIELGRDLDVLKQSALSAKQLVRIVAPKDSLTERSIKELLKTRTPGLTVASHPMPDQVSTAFLMRPTKKVFIMGNGNEANKLFQFFRYSAFGYQEEDGGLPVIGVGVHSLLRGERVINVFALGHDVYLTDVAKDKAGNVVQSFTNSVDLENEIQLVKNELIKAYIVVARAKVLNSLPESERRKKANDDAFFAAADQEGRRLAEEVFNKRFKGVASKAIISGEFDIIDDATPEGVGATNKELIYELALRANPDKEMIFMYQGGEKEKVAQASFNAVTADFEALRGKTHLRIVSCNTHGMSDINEPIVEDMGISIDYDNTAARRGPDPGDLKAGAPGIGMATKYHHGPDFQSVTPVEFRELMRINTDAAQIGTNTRFHIHFAYLRSNDGKPIDVKRVKRIQAVQSRVALVDYSKDVVDTIRLTEISTNLLPHSVKWAPDGTNHLLVPVLTIQKTDDPAQLREIYAVPQESIVATSNMNAPDALYGFASRDASLAIVNDATGLTEIVDGVQKLLPATVSSPVSKAVASSTLTPEKAFNKPVKASSAIFGSEPSVYGPHSSQAGLRPLFERIAWARKNAPDASYAIKDIYAFVDQKHGMDPKESISFGMVLADDHVITQNAPVMGGISAGSLEPDTHATVKDAIEFFNKNVRQRLIGLNIARPDEIGIKILQIDEEFRAQAKDKERPQFSYIGAELSVGISMMATIALAEELRVPTEVAVNYRYNEYAISNGLATQVRPMSIPINFGVVWEGGKHGVAKSLPELIREGIIKDASRFPDRFKEKPNDKKNHLAMVPPQELQIMVFAPHWAKARDIGIKLTTAYQKLLNQKYGIKTRYGAESGFTTDQMRDKDNNVITLDLVLRILDEAVASLKPQEAKFVRYALDIAASEMYIAEKDMYYIGPEAAGNDDGLVTNEQFTQYKLALFAKYPRFISCEDWADEGQIEHWNDAKMIMQNMIQMGDDNVVSKAELIRKYKDVMNAHLQKPNQSGEESVSLDAVATSHKLGNVVVWSHRGTRSPQEVYTAQGAIGTGSFAGKWTLWGPGRSALIAAMTQANALYNKGPYGDVNVPYQGALVLDPNGPYKEYGFAKRLRQEIGPLSAEERIDTSASSALEKKTGGIDFRANVMMINYQPIGNFSSLKLDLPKLSQADLDAFDVSKELDGIEKIVAGQMIPSGERIKEVLVASSQRGELDANRERLMAILVKVGILEESLSFLDEAGQGYKEALVLVDTLN